MNTVTQTMGLSVVLSVFLGWKNTPMVLENVPLDGSLYDGLATSFHSSVEIHQRRLSLFGFVIIVYC